MEGNSNKNYECEIVMNKSVSKDSIQTACNKVKQELEVFASRRTEILANSKVQEMIQNAPAVVQNNNNED